MFDFNILVKLHSFINSTCFGIKCNCMVDPTLNGFQYIIIGLAMTFQYTSNKIPNMFNFIRLKSNEAYNKSDLKIIVLFTSCLQG